MVLFIMLIKVVLTFESVDEIIKCDHSNESFWQYTEYHLLLSSSYWLPRLNLHAIDPVCSSSSLSTSYAPSNSNHIVI